MEEASSATQRPVGRKAPTKEPVLTVTNRRRQRASKVAEDGARLRSSAEPELEPTDKMRWGRKESALGGRTLRSAPATGRTGAGGSDATTRLRLGAPEVVQVVHA
eukprot:12421948-Karenia_brevis.AAC.1